MKILTTSRNVVFDKYGFFGALIQFEGSRKVYKAYLQNGTNEVLKIETEYKNKKAAFAANNVI